MLKFNAHRLLFVMDIEDKLYLSHFTLQLILQSERTSELYAKKIHLESNFVR